MMNKNLQKIFNSPLLFLKNSFNKYFVLPRKYSKNNDYDAQRYWSDRFTAHGDSFRAVGNEGCSEQENLNEYNEHLNLFNTIYQDLKINPQTARVLEIGCGNGFYTNFLRESGIINYTGIDITDTLFTKLKQRFSGYKFQQMDITSGLLAEKYDLILMIDVIQHIVTEEKFRHALINVKNSLSDSGAFVISPIKKYDKKHLFHVRFWDIDKLKSIFQNFKINHNESIQPFVIIKR